jgi:phenylalanyl-tRNA synthetase beta chain
LPDAERIADVLNFHAFEIEEIKAWDTDEILNVKVLADRACYALCHRGIASEISAGAIMKMKNFPTKVVKEEIKKKPEIDIKKPGLCYRYVGRRVENVKVADSPDWLRARLESIGERSINNIVDVANFVMFDIGQPLHAFDADKIKGAIQIRTAKNGEKMTTLDNREVELDSSFLIIADDEGPLAIAGIKGGKRAEVTKETKNLILESANFDRSSIRLVSTKLGLKTEASRRFEANLSPELAGEAMEAFSCLVKDVSPEAEFGPVNDLYKKKQKQVEIDISVDFISQRLGVSIGEDEIVMILKKLGIAVKKIGNGLVVFPPPFRTDLNIPEDIIEEVGRIYGYEKVVSKLPLPIRGQAIIEKNYFYTEKIKNILIENGFDEVSLYTLTNRGHFEVLKPLAEDKKFLRDNLSNGIQKCLVENAYNAPLLGLSEIRIFEIGNVFGPIGERVHVCIGRQTLMKKDRKNEDILQEIIGLLGSVLGAPLSAKVSANNSGAIAEVDITDLFRTARSPSSYNELNFSKVSENKFKAFSQFPFVLRDIAVFVPTNISKEEISEIIKKEAGELLVRFDLFDTFTKKMSDGSEKNSHAFHLVFQSMNKTLTDIDVNEVMNKITASINSKVGWQVR